MWQETCKVRFRWLILQCFRFHCFNVGRDEMTTFSSQTLCPIVNHPMSIQVPWRWVKSYWRWIGGRNFYVRAVRCHHQSLEVEFKLQWVQCVFCNVLLSIQIILDNFRYTMIYLVLLSTSVEVPENGPVLSTRSVRRILRNCKDAGWPNLPQPVTVNNNQQANSFSEPNMI